MKQQGRAKLGRTASHRKSLLKNQLRSLVKNGKISTTTQKGKALKANAQSVISRVNRDGDTLVIKRYLDELLGTADLRNIMLKYASSGKGRIQIIKVGFRDGDNAQVSRIVMTDYDKIVGTKKRSKQVSEKSKTKEASKTEVVNKSDSSKQTDRKSGSRLTKSFKSKFTGSKERSNTRSGL